MSYLLNKKGLSHIILDRKSKTKPLELAETLPPSAMPLLHKIGLLELFTKHSIRKTYGYHSLWGSDRLTTHNFYFHNPYKYGLKIDKCAIIKNLEQTTKTTILAYDNQLHLNRITDGFEIKYQTNTGNKKISTRLIVDATGRSRAVLKKLNIDSVRYDDTLAFTCHLPKKKHPKLKHDVFVESFNDGWGLVSGNGECQNVVSIFTNSKSSIYSKVSAYKHWKEILSNTQYLNHFLSDELTYNVVGKLSNSSKPTQVAGPNWLAIGDAALAFDPLSSHGVSNAIFTALSAAESSQRYFETNNKEEKENTIRTYDESIDTIFQSYLSSKDSLYTNERRWPNSSYWLHQNNGTIWYKCYKTL